MTTEAKVVLTARDDTQRAFKSVRTSLRGMESAAMSARRALGAIGLGLSAGAVVSSLSRAAMEAITYGDNIAKAAVKTGVAASAFSELAYAARQNDVSLEALGTAFRRLQQSISLAGSGAKTQLETFKALGVEFEAFRRLSPDRQFEILADRIMALKDPADRTRAAVELFGRSGAELLPLFEQGASGIRKFREEAVRTGRALTEEQVAKLAEADLAIKNLTASWEAFSRSITADIAPALTKLIERLSVLRSVKASDIADTLADIGPSATWADLERQVGRRLFREEQAARQGAMWNGLDPVLMRQSAGAAARSRPPPGFPPPSAEPGDALREVNVWQRRIWDSTNAFNEWADQFERDWSEDFAREVIKFSNETDRMSMVIEDNRGALSEWAEFAGQAARNMQDAFANFLFDPFEDGIKGMLRSFADMLRQMLAQLAAQAILREFFAWGSTLSGGIGAGFRGFAAGLGIPGRATGGPVSAGSPYMVGERGPELFVPSSSGTILPNGAGGAVVVNNYVTINDETDLRRSMPAIMAETTRQSVAAAKASIRGDMQRYGKVR